MLRSDLDASSNHTNQSSRILKNIILILSILLGLSCLSGFIVTSIYWDLHTKLVNQCKNDNQQLVLCYIRLIINNVLDTHWNKHIIVSLLFTYANVFFHIIIESSRTNVSGLLGQMILQTIFIIIGIGVCYPILFIPSYIYFYKKTTNYSTGKSPVRIDILCLALTYIILIIILPTYLLYFLSSNKLLVSIMSIILLVSPLGFALISLPFRLFSESMQRCWVINSHRLIACCQIILFILTAPLFFITFVSLIMHWSFDLIKHSYVTEITNVNPIIIIWSIDYLGLFIGLILFIITNEVLITKNNYRDQSSRIQIFFAWLIFTLLFIISPCLTFPLYVAWNEYRYIPPT